MYDQDSKGISWTAGFFMLILFTIGSAILGSILANLIWKLQTGSSEGIIAGISNPAYSNASKVAQSISALIGFLLPALLTTSMMSRKPLKVLGFEGKIMPAQAGIVIGIIVTAMLVSSAIGYLGYSIRYPQSWVTYFTKLEREYGNQMIAVLGSRTNLNYVIALITLGFIPALCEEALFRGGLQNFLTRSSNRPWFAIIIVAIIFSIAHISGFSFLPRLFLGVVLGAIYYYTGRLWLSILAHFLNNALYLTIIFFTPSGNKTMSDVINDQSGSYWGFALLPVVILLFILLKRISGNTRVLRASVNDNPY